jgi:hypothetical protein
MRGLDSFTSSLYIKGKRSISEETVLHPEVQKKTNSFFFFNYYYKKKKKEKIFCCDITNPRSEANLITV